MFVCFQSLWTSILYHVTDQHEWATGACHHAPLPKSHTHIWIEEDSVAHATLISVIMNQMWLKDVERFLPFRYRPIVTHTVVDMERMNCSYFFCHLKSREMFLYENI